MDKSRKIDLRQASKLIDRVVDSINGLGGCAIQSLEDELIFEITPDELVVEKNAERFPEISIASLYDVLDSYELSLVDSSPSCYDLRSLGMILLYLSWQRGMNIR